mmetsp:Transcript_3500/g.3243  ORF Transcript_3500/g.3243 Transcript_3500/m.3243 type:complete len:90 (-) Transcript_3500:63-332(-)
MQSFPAQVFLMEESKSSDQSSDSPVAEYRAVLQLLKEYNLKFVCEWTKTYNFHKWKSEKDSSSSLLDSDENQGELLKEVLSKRQNIGLK